MLALFVVLALTVGAFADGDHCCTTEDRREIERLWRGIWSAEHTGHRVALAQSVFEDLFENHPEVKSLFDRVNADTPDSPEFRAHCIRVVQGLDLAINELADPEVLEEALAHLSDQHQAREGLKAAHFDAIGQSFLAVMPQVTSCFNPKAWEHCFNRIAHGIAAGLP